MDGTNRHRRGAEFRDAALSTPQIAPQRLAYMTPEWNAAFRSAAVRADELGLELADRRVARMERNGRVRGSNLKDGMKKLVERDRADRRAQLKRLTAASADFFRRLSVCSAKRRALRIF